MPIAVLGGAGVSVYTDGGGFTIPKRGSTGHAALELGWTETDHQINDAGHLGQGVTRGCRVTAQSTPTLALNVASGTVMLRGVSVSVAACVAIPNPPVPTLDRIDVVAVHKLSSGAGHVVLITGTPSGVPYPPLLPSGYLGLAFVFVGAGVNVLRSTEIVDKRILLIAPTIPVTPSAVLSTNLDGLALSAFDIQTINFTIVPFAGTLRNFYFRTSTAQSGSGDLYVIVVQNAGVTALGTLVPAGTAAGIFSDTTHTVAVAAGDWLTLYLQNGNGTSAALEEVSLEIDP